MSPRSQFLLHVVEEMLGTSATNVAIGTCPHTCEIQVKMGQKNPINIGRRSRYCPICRRSFLHDLEPHSATTQAQLRDRLHEYDTTQADKTARRRAETVAARTAQRAILRARLTEKSNKAKRKITEEDTGATMTTSLSSPSNRQTAHTTSDRILAARTPLKMGSPNLVDQNLFTRPVPTLRLLPPYLPLSALRSSHLAEDTHTVEQSSSRLSLGIVSLCSSEDETSPTTAASTTASIPIVRKMRTFLGTFDLCSSGEEAPVVSTAAKKHIVRKGRPSLGTFDSYSSSHQTLPASTAPTTSSGCITDSHLLLGTFDLCSTEGEAAPTASGSTKRKYHGFSPLVNRPQTPIVISSSDESEGRPIQGFPDGDTPSKKRRKWKD